MADKGEWLWAESAEVSLIVSSALLPSASPEEAEPTGKGVEPDSNSELVLLSPECDVLLLSTSPVGD